MITEKEVIIQEINCLLSELMFMGEEDMVKKIREILLHVAR